MGENMSKGCQVFKADHPMDPVQSPQGNNSGVWKDILKILQVSVEDETLENIDN